jgi:hypothetical protein
MRASGLFFALSLTLLCAVAARGQSASGSVTVSGRVSGAVFLNVSPGAEAEGGAASFTHRSPGRDAVAVSVRTTGGAGGRVRVPLQLRSNVGYELAVSIGAGAAAVRGFCVEGARASGRFVAPAAVAAAEASCAGDSPAPAVLLKGPAISLSGAPASPSNALEVWLLVELAPQAEEKTDAVELLLTASPTLRPRP